MTTQLNLLEPPQLSNRDTSKNEAKICYLMRKRLINTSLIADTLDVSSMSSWMYLVKVTVEGQSKTSKLIEWLFSFDPTVCLKKPKS